MTEQDYKPCGTNILVEILKASEVFNSSLIVPDETKTPSLQGLVVGIGPALDQAQWGVSVGDRVILWGDFVPVPKPKNRIDNGRVLGIFQPHSIKCVVNV